jgi:hypothetical protein
MWYTNDSGTHNTGKKKTTLHNRKKEKMPQNKTKHLNSRFTVIYKTARKAIRMGWVPAMRTEVFGSRGFPTPISINRNRLADGVFPHQLFPRLLHVPDRLVAPRRREEVRRFVGPRPRYRRRRRLGTWLGLLPLVLVFTVALPFTTERGVAR